MTTRTIWLARGAIFAQALFVASWFLLGFFEGHGYSAAAHDISDLGALTAHHASFLRAALGISGLLTIAFAVFALRPALLVPGRGEPVGAWLVAVSLPALDNLGDAFFRLDCRAADAGCTFAHSTASWHAQLHVIIFLVAAVPTIAAPFALAHRMKLLPAWTDLAHPARVFGVVTVVCFAGGLALSGTDQQGSAQRVLAVLVPLGIVALAGRVSRIARSEAGSLAVVR